MKDKREFLSEFIVVGSGPGGATVARELARRGKEVLILERGVDHRKKVYYGTYLGALIYSDRRSLLFTQEGLNIIRPIMVGGATSMYCACASPPPPWLKERYGIDIEEEVNRTMDELSVSPLPEELRGRASTRIAEAASSLGHKWFPQPKFIQLDKAKGFSCTASCMLGCRCGAKWNAAQYVDEAVRLGAKLLTRARVNRVLTRDGRAMGVEGSLAGRPFCAHGHVVIISAGGIGTPRILQASGMDEAGRGMAMDTTVMVYGLGPTEGTGREPPMTWSWINDDDGYMLSTLTDPWLLFPIMAARANPRFALLWPKWGRLLGIMIKLKDEMSGGVFPNGKISKPMTNADQQRLSSARSLCERILKEAGARPSSIFMSPLRGTHPSATVRIGQLLNEDLSTGIRGLYVCDASVFPEALDRPTVLTIIGLAKRLAKELCASTY